MSIQSAHRSNDENTRPHSGSASSREADLGSAPIGSLLFKLALPAIAAQIINVLYNMVDRMYIGHIPDIGPSALTGVGVTMPIIMCISAFAALAAMGGAPQASILMGKGDKDSAEKVLGNCTFMLTVISLVLTVLFLGFGRPILLMFGASEKTILYAWNYMKIYVCGRRLRSRIRRVLCVPVRKRRRNLSCHAWRSDWRRLSCSLQKVHCPSALTPAC